MTHAAGQAAEAIVAQRYAQLGWILEQSRWRSAAGEIDLIFARDDMRLFVEVKKSRSFDRAAERLGRGQIERLCLAAQDYLGQCPDGAMTECRFDVALVNEIGDVRLLENALPGFV